MHALDAPAGRSRAVRDHRACFEIDEVAEHVHVTILVRRADLESGNDLHSHFCSNGGRGREGRRRVVVRDRDYIEPALRRSPHHGLGRPRAVGSSGVDVKVELHGEGPFTYVGTQPSLSSANTIASAGICSGGPSPAYSVSSVTRFRSTLSTPAAT